MVRIHRDARDIAKLEAACLQPLDHIPSDVRGRRLEVHEVPPSLHKPVVGAMVERGAKGGITRHERVLAPGEDQCRYPSGERRHDREAARGTPAVRTGIREP